MARRPPRPARIPESEGEPAAGTSFEPGAESDHIEESATGPQRDPAASVARRNARPTAIGPSGGLAAKRVAAAAAAAGAAAAGVAEPAAIGTDASIATAEAATVAVSSGAASAAAFAVNVAIAATNAARAAHRLEANPGVTNGAAPPAAGQPVTVQSYRRAPAKVSPYIIRARAEAADWDPTSGMNASGAESTVPTTDNPNRRYMRRQSPDPADRPLAPVESQGRDRPAPLFSNEGIVRQAEARRRRRLIGPFGGFAATIFGAGAALGHSGESGRPTAPVLVDDPGEVILVAATPDFDPRGRPRPTTHHRLTGLLLAMVTLVFAVAAVGLTAALPPSDKASTASAGSATSQLQAGVNPNGPLDAASTAPAAEDTSVLPSGLVLGDDPLPPGATRRPVQPGIARTPAPTATVSRTAGPSQTAPGSSASQTAPGSSASPPPTRAPTPTPPAAPTPTPTPTRSPTPTPVPTPSPTAVMFTLVYSVAPPAVAPGNGHFYVASLPGATCRLHRLPVTGDNVSRTSNPFTTDKSSGWADILWGALWPATPTSVTAKFYGFCTAAAPDTRTAQSDYVSVQWPPRASPTPTPS
jgi:hypothetical protein